MPNDVTAAVKAKFPEYANTPDDLVTATIAAKYPEYKDNFSFSADLDRIANIKPMVSDVPNLPDSTPDTRSTFQWLKDGLVGASARMAQLAGTGMAGVGKVAAGVLNIENMLQGKDPTEQPTFESGKPIFPKAVNDAFETASEFLLRGTDIAGRPLPPSGQSEGLAKSARKTFEGLQTPEGLATLPLLESRLGRAAFTVMLATQTPERVQETADVLSDPNTSARAKWEAVGDAGVHLAMLAGTALSLRPADVKATMTPEQAAKVVEPGTPPIAPETPASEQTASGGFKGGPIEPLVPAPPAEPLKPAETPLAAKAEEIAPIAPLTAEALKQTAGIKEPLITDAEVKDFREYFPITSEGKSDAELLAEMNLHPKGYRVDIENAKIDRASEEIQKTINPGGSQADLPPEAKAISEANNAKEAWAKMGFEIPKKEPVVDQSVNKPESEGSDAIQKQVAGESVLREARPGVELPPVGEGNAGPEKSSTTQEEIPAQPHSGTPETVTPEMINGGLTSIKNAVVDQERASRGLPSAIEPARRGFEDVWDATMRHIDQDPTWQDSLIAELKDKPRALTDTEDAAILHRQVELQNEYEKAAKAVVDNADNPEELAVAQRRRAAASDALLDIYNIGKQAGTETGRGLNARKMLANEDFSLASMELQKRAANDGKPLTPDQSAEISALHDKINQTQKDFDDYKEKAESRIRQMELEKAVRQLEQEAQSVKPGAQKKTVIQQAKELLSQKADAARERIKARLREGRQAAGLDPADLADHVIVATDLLAKGVTKFADFSARMIKEFGDYVKPHLQQIFDEAKKVDIIPVAETTQERRASLAESMSDNEDPKPSQIRRYATELARTFVKDGIKDRNKLVDAVHGEMVKKFPEMTRRETSDAVSGYGDFKPLSKDEVDVTLRDLKGQLQSVSKLEDIEAKKPIQSSGPERAPITDEQRRLTKQVNEAKKKYGVVVTDPARQLKSALDSIKTRLKNSIADLEHEIATKQKIVRQKSAVPTDAEVDTLRARRDELKRQQEALFGDRQLTDEQRLKIAMDSAKRSLEDYDRRIKERDFSTNKKTPQSSPELDAIKARRDALKAEFEELRDLDPKYADEQAGAELERKKAALEKSIAAKLDKLKSGDVSTAGKQVNRPVSDPELETLIQKRDALNEQISELRNPTLTREESALKALKTRLANRAAELKERLANKDFSTKKKTPVPLDAEATRLQAANEKAKLDFRRGLVQDRLANRSKFEKASDVFTKWRRGALLSGPVTLFKLTSAAVERAFITPVEEAVGYGISKAIPSVASKAAREGGFSAAAEAKAFTSLFTTGMKDAYQTLRKGASDLEVLYGKPKMEPESWMDLPGRIHAVLKAPVKRNEFTRSFQKRSEAAIRQGLDVSDPLVQTRLAVDAYTDANKAIFLQKNWLADRIKRFTNSLEEKNKTTGKVPIAGKLGATAMRTALPIVRVPINIVAETMQYAVGSVTGSARLARAIHNGMENLHPEEADMIMRSLKKGSMGAGMLALGYFAPNIIGGYYQPGKKPGKNDVKFGSVRVGGQDIPPFLLHNPLLETLQIGATIRHVADSKLRRKDLEKQGIGAGTVAATLGVAGQLPFMREVGDIGKLNQPYERGKFLREYDRNIVIPAGVSQAAEYFDKDAKGNPIKRDAKNFGQELETGIPVLRTNVPIDRKKTAAARKK